MKVFYHFMKDLKNNYFNESPEKYYEEPKKYFFYEFLRNVESVYLALMMGTKTASDNEDFGANYFLYFKDFSSLAKI